MFVDTHAHLYWDSYQEDLDHVLAKCKEVGVTTIINIGTDLETSRQAIKTAQDLKDKGFRSYATIGVHPHDGDKFNTDESIRLLIEDLENLYNDNKDIIVGIGECGLDHYSPVIPEKSGIQEDSGSRIDVRDDKHESQKKLFQAQVVLAKKLNLPLIIHCRNAWEDIFIPELKGTKGLFHNFTGTEVEVKKALELGYHLSFSCILTYPKNQPLRDLLKTIPLDKILTETDCPFLPPQQIRGQRNDPSYIPEVIKVISEMKGLTFEETADQIRQNTQELFNLK